MSPVAEACAAMSRADGNHEAKPGVIECRHVEPDRMLLMAP